MSVIGGAGRGAALIQFETQKLHEAVGDRSKVARIVTSSWRMSVYIGKCKNELFDLGNDPGEFVNLWDDAQFVKKTQLPERLSEVESTAVSNVPVPLSEA